MTYYSYNKEGVVQFANDLLVHLKPGSQLTMTIGRDEYVDFYATFVITESLGDTVKTQSRPSTTT
jgi:hypothetical protein